MLIYYMYVCMVRLFMSVCKWLSTNIHRLEEINLKVSFIASEANYLVCSMARIFYIFQAVCRAVYVLNVSTCI